MEQEDAIGQKDQRNQKDPKSKPMKEEELYHQYHPVFCDAMVQTLEQDAVCYEYLREYNLNSMPNRIDFLVIKKDVDAVSDKSIGRIFKRYNIFEYKSPGQQLSIDEYYRTMAYAYLYASNKKDASMEDIAISFAREGKPGKLLAFFRKQGFHIENPKSGIYHIRKQGQPDMQVIVLGMLDYEYLWIKSLTDKLTLEDAIELAVEAKKETDYEGRQRIQSILDLVSKLNEKSDWMKEVRRMGAFRDLFKEDFEERDRKIKDLSEQLENKNKQLQSQNEQLENKDKQLQSKNEQLENKDKQLQSKNEQLESKDKQLKNKNKQLKDKDKEVKSLKDEIEQLKEQIRKNKIAML